MKEFLTHLLTGLKRSNKSRSAARRTNRPPLGFEDLESRWAPATFLAAYDAHDVVIGSGAGTRGHVRA